MNSYISMLRGINVSGQKKIKMEALKKSYESLNFQNVQTYIQSGNVVFQSNELDIKELTQLISSRIKQDFGFDVPLLVFTAEAYKKIIIENPFIQDETIDIKHLHVTFLSDLPIYNDLSLVENKIQQNESILLINKAIYIHAPNGYGQTKLTNNLLESKLKVSATTRNWKTCLKLLEMVES